MTFMVGLSLAALCVLAATLPTGTPAVTAGTATPSPGPLATLEPMPCHSGVNPSTVRFHLDSAPEGQVPRDRTVTKKGQVLKVYRAVCALPPVDVQSLKCVASPHKVEYSVAFWKGRYRTLLVSLDMGGCQAAWFLGGGYSATYRLPKSFVSLVAQLIGVRTSRLSPQRVT
jgi:hypothetical protein